MSFRIWPLTALGAQLATKPSVTYPAGFLGAYSATGPIPATNQKVELARKPVGTVNVLVAQPLSTQYQLHLQLKALALGLEGTRQDEEKTRLEMVDQVRRAYYAVVEAQSALDSLQASLPYYTESHRLALVNRGKETILESDLLNADTQLLKIQDAINDANDRVASASERLNDLMGRDVHTQFRVVAIGDADTDLATSEAMEDRALHNRPDVKKAKLQVQQADYDARAKKAEYIPDVSLAFSYYTTANFENIFPSNVGTVGMSLRWEPWDWGRRHHEYQEKRAKEDQAKVGVGDTERAILLEVRDACRQLENIHDLPQGVGPILYIKDFGDTSAFMLTVASLPADPAAVAWVSKLVETQIRRVRSSLDARSGLTIATFVTLGLVPVLYSFVVLDLKLIRWEQKEELGSAASEKPETTPLTSAIAG